MNVILLGRERGVGNRGAGGGQGGEGIQPGGAREEELAPELTSSLILIRGL